MKLHTYIKHLEEINKKYPNLDVIYASDDEGNSFNLVQFWPDVGLFSERNHEFDWDVESNQLNAVCIN